MLWLWIAIAITISLSFIYGAISIYSIVKRLRYTSWLSVEVREEDLKDLPSVAILLPFYRERREDIEATFRSVAKQVYPRDKMLVVVAVERDDIETLRRVEELRHVVESEGIELIIAMNRSDRKSKAVALNHAIESIPKPVEFVVVYDAGDIVEDEFHIAKIALLIKRGFEVVGSKVYRVGVNIIGKLSFLDTLLWYNVALPGITRLIGYPLMSGEGLALSMKFLKEIGGFPDKLTEDSYITIFIALHGKRAALLDAVIYEGAPSTISSFIKQRLRWYRGYLECFKDLLTKYSRRLKPIDTLRLSIAYIEPVALLSTTLAFITIALSVFVDIPSVTMYVALLAFILTLFAPLYIVLDLNIRDSVIMLAPLYWVFQGFIVLTSLIPLRIPWLRTTRIPIESLVVRELEERKRRVFGEMKSRWASEK